LEAKFREFTRERSPARERWTDAYLAAFALTSGARLVTFVKGFKRFQVFDWLRL
jgi:predicted nucleic acid-binding protein